MRLTVRYFAAARAAAGAESTVVDIDPADTLGELRICCPTATTDCVAYGALLVSAGRDRVLRPVRRAGRMPLARRPATVRGRLTPTNPGVMFIT